MSSRIAAATTANRERTNSHMPDDPFSHDHGPMAITPRAAWDSYSYFSAVTGTSVAARSAG